jgi:hypothetical protein
VGTWRPVDHRLVNRARDCCLFPVPPLTKADRTLMVLVSSFCRTWQGAMLIVAPNTVLRWHREGFRLLWK